MSDVFLSYSREDAAKAKNIAIALKDEGFDVWWDQRIPAGLTWREYIPQKIEGAPAVVVLWSQASVSSEWVQEEAGLAKGMKKLVPVNIDGVQPPFGFREIECADLARWRGARDHPEWLNLVEGLRRVLARAARHDAQPHVPDNASRTPPSTVSAKHSAALEPFVRKPGLGAPVTIALGALILSVVGLVAWTMLPRAGVVPNAVSTEAPPSAYDVNLLPATVADVVQQARQSAEAGQRIEAEVRGLLERAQNAARAARASEEGYEVRDFGRVLWEGERLELGRRLLGTKTFRDGGIQTGQFRFDGTLLTAGPAVQRLPQGAEFFGSDSANALAWDGSGVFRLADGSVHSGTWRLRGSALPGVLSLSDGRRYEGQFRHLEQTGYDMQRDGLGVLWDAQGRPVQVGRWESGEFVERIR